LILPVVICLSKRLSHACLSISKLVLWNCERLIKSVIIYLIVFHSYMDNRRNSRANTWKKSGPLSEGRMNLLDYQPTQGIPNCTELVSVWALVFLRQLKVIQNNLSNRRGIYVGDDTNEFLPYQLSTVV